MWAAFEAYEQALARRDRVDWGDVPRRLWQLLETGQFAVPPYDAILVDEAQFFAPLWFEILKRVLKPRVGHLFLVADPSQGFLRRRQSWLASGLDVRGRAHRLNRSYRTTRAILGFARAFYQHRLPEEDEEVVVPSMQEMPEGIPPQLIQLTSPQDEMTRVVNEVLALQRAGAPPGHILILHAEWQGAVHMLARLRKTLRPTAARDAKEGGSDSHVRVCTLNAATGLESPIVFLVGIHTLYEAEQSLGLRHFGGHKG